MHMRETLAEVTLGCAAASEEAGIAYARVQIGQIGQREHLLRIPFACRPLPALHGRDVAYAAVEAVAARLLRRGIRRVVFQVAEPELVADLAGRRNVPAPLSVPYVTLRCRLNRFTAAHIVLAQDERGCRDLEARARAEVSLDIAA